MNPGGNDLGLEELLNFWASGGAPEEKLSDSGMLTVPREIETPASFLVPPQTAESSSTMSMASTMMLPAAEFTMLPSTMSEGPFDHSIAHQTQHVPDFSLTWAEPLALSSTSFASACQCLQAMRRHQPLIGRWQICLPLPHLRFT